MYCQLPKWIFLVVINWFLTPTSILSQDSQLWIDNISLLKLEEKGGFFQDTRGFIWKGGADLKLQRFDGHTIKSFPANPGDPFAHSGCSFWGVTSQLLEDSEGKIWILSPENCLDRYDPILDRFEKFKGRMQALAKEEKLAGTRNFIYEDSKKNVWIAMNTGLYKYSLVSKKLDFYNTKDPVTLVFEDKANNIWVNAEINNKTRYLALLDETTGKLGDRIDLDLPLSLPSYYNRKDMANRIKGKEGWLLFIGFNLLLFAPEKRKVVLPPNLPFDTENFPYGFLVKDSLVLIGTALDELYQFLPETMTFEKCDLFPKATPGEEEWIDQIVKGKGGSVWLSKGDTYFILSPQQTAFKIKRIPENVSGVKEDVQFAGATLLFQGNVYFNTTTGLIPVRKSVRERPDLNLKIDGIKNHLDVVYKFDTDEEGNLWMAASGFRAGRRFLHFRQFNPDGLILYQYTCNSGNDGCSAANYRLSFLEVDRIGRLWVGSRNSLSYFDPKKSTFQYHYSSNQRNSPLFGNRIRSIHPDRDNEVWIGTTNAGLLRFNPESDEWNIFNYGASGNDGNELAVYSIFQDSNDKIWVGTELALIKINKTSGKYKRYTKKDLFSVMPINKVFEDYQQNIWIIVGSNLLRYYPEDDRFIPFDEKDGVLSSGYYNSEFIQDDEHFIYLSSNYFEQPYFHPDSFKINTTIPSIYFSDFQLANTIVKPRDSTKILRKALDFTKSITLDYEYNDFTIHYTAPEYIHPNETVFATQLQGFNNKWQQVGMKKEARFTNLNPGKYTFKVKVRNHHGFWSEVPRTLEITILPPWYRTWWAWCLWVTLFLGSIYALYRFQLNRRLVESEAQRLKELDQAKSQLYTNITHEFRTPLTIILGMADQMKSDPKNWFSEGLKLIRRNGKQLLYLINQLLDLSKLESGHMLLNPVQGDVVSYLHYLVESFHSYADNKDIRLHFLSPQKEFLMDFDPEKLQHVVSNLLSNAIKFTPEGGDIYVSLDHSDFKIHHNLKLIVKDNGHGISAENLPHIFDRFYQVDNSHTRRGEGTGIGLALTKELVRVMGGSIEVESEEKVGTTFTIQLPVSRKAQPYQPTTTATTFIPADLVEVEKVKEIGSIQPNERPVVLLIEDNADVITYLTSFLSTGYQLLTAKDGQTGIKMALEHIPDLIVSDVMMPLKDGFEVCATLKTDEHTSHIPVILLTAKSDQPSKITGLTHGADAYLSKPFNKEELLVRMEKLIELRNQLQLRYKQPGSLRAIMQATAVSQDDLFLQKIIRIVEANLADENFGMHGLCSAVNMSRSHLFRKLKAITGKSTTVFIRTLRLEKARELLLTSDLNISEVAYEVGFNNPKYFSRVFVEEFGIAPREIRK